MYKPLVEKEKNAVGHDHTPTPHPAHVQFKCRISDIMTKSTFHISSCDMLRFNGEVRTSICFKQEPTRTNVVCFFSSRALLLEGHTTSWGIVRVPIVHTIAAFQGGCSYISIVSFHRSAATGHQDVRSPSLADPRACPYCAKPYIL